MAVNSSALQAVEWCNPSTSCFGFCCSIAIIASGDGPMVCVCVCVCVFARGRGNYSNCLLDPWTDTLMPSILFLHLVLTHVLRCGKPISGIIFNSTQSLEISGGIGYRTVLSKIPLESLFPIPRGDQGDQLWQSASTSVCVCMCVYVCVYLCV